MSVVSRGFRTLRGASGEWRCEASGARRRPCAEGATPCRSSPAAGPPGRRAGAAREPRPRASEATERPREAPQGRTHHHIAARRERHRRQVARQHVLTRRRSPARPAPYPAVRSNRPGCSPPRVRRPRAIPGVRTSHQSTGGPAVRRRMRRLTNFLDPGLGVDVVDGPDLQVDPAVAERRARPPSSSARNPERHPRRLPFEPAQQPRSKRRADEIGSLHRKSAAKTRPDPRSHPGLSSAPRLRTTRPRPPRARPEPAASAPSSARPAPAAGPGGSCAGARACGSSRRATCAAARRRASRCSRPKARPARWRGWRR